MADYFVVDGGTGDGSYADPWGLGTIGWDAVVNNTLYFLDTFVLAGSFNLGYGRSNLTLRGDYVGRPASINGGGVAGSLFHASTALATDILVQGFTFSNAVNSIDSNYIRFNNCSEITVRECVFDGSVAGEYVQAIRVYTPSTGNIVANVLIEDNTFIDISPREPLESTPRGNCIMLEYNVTDGNYVDGFDIRRNTATGCQQFYKGPIYNSALTRSQYMAGLRIDNNVIDDCERAIQQVHWQLGSSGSPSYIRYNKITNIGTPGANGVGTHQMNLIQLSDCGGGEIYSNYLETWEKEDDAGDGCGIILDWANKNVTYFCEDIAVYDNEIKNSCFTVTGNYPRCPGIEVYRAKNCDIYNNRIINCRTGITVSGQPTNPVDSSGNWIHDNFIDLCREGIHLFAEAETNTIEDNTVTNVGIHTPVTEYVLGRGWEDHHYDTEDQHWGANATKTLSSVTELSINPAESVEVYGAWVRSKNVNGKVQIGLYTASITVDQARPVDLMGSDHIFTMDSTPFKTFNYNFPTPLVIPAGRYIAAINADASRPIAIEMEGPGYHRASDNTSATYPALPDPWVHNDDVLGDVVVGYRTRSVITPITVGPALSAPTNTPTLDGAVIGCTTNDTNGTAYGMARDDRQWYSVANGDSQALADADKATIIAQDITASELVWAGTDVDLTSIELIVDGLSENSGPFYVGWVQDTEGSSYGTDLVMEFDVSSKSLTIPAGNTGTYNADIDWGNGDSDHITAYNDPLLTKTYAAEDPDTVIVRISGSFPWLYFNNAGDKAKLTKVLQLGDIGWESIASAFRGCTNIIAFSSGVTDTSNTSSASFAFFQLTSITGGADISSVRLTNASTIAYAFRDWTHYDEDLDLSQLDIPNCTNIDNALQNFGYHTSRLYDFGLDQWLIPKVTAMTNFMIDSQMSVSAYDRTLASWGNQTLAAGALSTTAHFGSSQYTDETSKNLLLNQVAGIIDGGAFDTDSPIFHAITSEFLATGAGSHEMLAQFEGTGTPTFTHSGLLLPDHEGVYVEIAANNPPWHGVRWDNGIPYGDDGTGTLLAVAPSLYAAPALTNALTYSNDLTQWTQAGTDVSALDAVGLTGAANTATTLTDNDAAGFESVSQTVTVVANTETSTVRVFVKKDEDTSRFPEVQVRYDTNVAALIQINTSTGDLTDRGGASTSAASLVGGWWQLLISAPNETKTTIKVDIFPAVTTVAGQAEAPATGSCIVGNVELHVGKTIAEVRGAAPLISGATAASSDAVQIEYDVKNHRDEFGGYYLEVTQQAAGGILSSFLSVVGSNIQLSDGTTTATSAWVTDTPYKIGVAYGSSMALCVDGVWSADLAYDDTLVSGALDLFRSATGTGIARNVQRYELDYDDAKAKVTELMT